LTEAPGQRATARITTVCGRAHALRVVRASMKDYTEAFRL
jgi:hypothetical protein